MTPPRSSPPWPSPSIPPGVQVAGEVRDALAVLVRAIDRAALMRNARVQPALPFEQAAAALERLTQLRGDITLIVQPGALTCLGEIVYAEPAEKGAERFCARLHGDGVRTLILQRGLDADDVAGLAKVLQPGPLGREDAATELWKRDLRHISFTASRGYELSGSFADDDAAETIAAIAGRARGKLEAHSRPEASSTPQPLWDEKSRQRRDSPKPGDLERRAALIILRIVSQGHAGWDLEALEEAYRRLVDELFDRGEVQPLLPVLEGALRLGGTQAPAFRLAIARTQTERPRMLRAIELGALEPRLLPAFLALLPADAGLLLTGLAPQFAGPARAALCEAALQRLEGCQRQVEELLRKGDPQLALAILGALPVVSDETRRGQLAICALEHDDLRVKLAAIPYLSPTAPNMVALLSQLLAHPQRELRLSAAFALGTAVAQREQAAALLMGVLARPSRTDADPEELEVLHSALGRLGSAAGFSYLSDRLTRAPRGLFGRRKAEGLQLLALQGLLEEKSSRSLQVLLTLLASPEGHGSRLLEACRAGSLTLRAAVRGTGR